MNTVRLLLLTIVVALLQPVHSMSAQAAAYSFIFLDQPIGPPLSVNSAGQVALSTIDQEYNPRAARWSIPEDGLLPLGTLAAHDPRSHAAAISERGHIVGTFYDGENHLAHPFLWTPTHGIQPLPSLGGSQTAPIDINNRDEVVGWSSNEHGVRRAFLWAPDAGIRDLGSLAESTGTALTERDSVRIGLEPIALAAARSEPHVQKVVSAVLDAEWSQALAVNEHGWVVGSSVVVDGQKHPMLTHPFLWKPETGMVDLGLLPGFDEGGTARDINSQGQVLVALLKRRPNDHSSRVSVLGSPYLWTEYGGFEELPSPPGYNDVRPVAINNTGEILLQAAARGAEDRAPFEWAGFLIAGGELRELPAVEDAEYTRYSDIDDRGNLVGSTVAYELDEDGRFLRRHTRGFVAVPEGAAAAE